MAKKKKARSKNRVNSGAVIVNAKDKVSLNLEDIEKAANKAKRTRADSVKIVVGPETEVADDVRDFAAKRAVEIATMGPDEPSLPKPD